MGLAASPPHVPALAAARGYQEGRSRHRLGSAPGHTGVGAGAARGEGRDQRHALLRAEAAGSHRFVRGAKKQKTGGNNGKFGK